MVVQNLRFGWIEGCLRYAGVFGAHEKSGYIKVFGVSESAMSRHQSSFAEIVELYIGHPVFERNQNGSLLGGKLVISPSEMLPHVNMFPVPALERWLEDVMGARLEKAAFIARRSPDLTVLRGVISAIRSNYPISIEYMSRSGKASKRVISPHSLVDVVGRYHVRAFDHAKNRYGDFVLARIRNLFVPDHQAVIAYIGPKDDKDWHDRVAISITVRKGALSEGVRADWGLDEDGVRTMQVRSALASYLIDEPAEGYESPVRVLKA